MKQNAVIWTDTFVEALLKTQVLSSDLKLYQTGLLITAIYSEDLEESLRKLLSNSIRKILKSDISSPLLTTPLLNHFNYFYGAIEYI